MLKQYVKGGKKMAAFFKKAQQAARQPIKITVGFHDPSISATAVLLEFGHAATNLPERPAFRVGLEHIKAEAGRRWADLLQRAHKRKEAWPSRSEVGQLGIWARDTVRQAYFNFHGASLSKRQKARKEGTPYVDEQLIGAEGPKLVGHIHAYINGQQVGE